MRERFGIENNGKGFFVTKRVDGDSRAFALLSDGTWSKAVANYFPTRLEAVELARKFGVLRLPFEDLADDLISKINALKKSEAGSLCYCDDPQDGCAEIWCDEKNEFQKSLARFQAWLDGDR